MNALPFTTAPAANRNVVGVFDGNGDFVTWLRKSEVKGWIAKATRAVESEIAIRAEQREIRIANAREYLAKRAARPVFVQLDMFA